MSTREDIQKSIDSAVSARESWNAELLKLNASLVSAKGTAKTRIKRAIRNAEDQIKDLDRSIAKLTNDLRRVSIVDTKAETKNIYAEKGINPTSQIVSTVVEGAKDIVGNIYSNNDSLPVTQKKSSSEHPDNNNTQLGFDKKYLIYAAIAVVVLMLIKKR